MTLIPLPPDEKGRSPKGGKLEAMEAGGGVDKKEKKRKGGCCGCLGRMVGGCIWYISSCLFGLNMEEGL